MKPIDLQSFETFIRNRKLAPERNIPYYASWVRRFLQSEPPASNLKDEDQIIRFNDQLERDSLIEDWQVRQAIHAVQLYLNIFLKQAQTQEQTKEQQSSTPTDETELLQKMRTLIRLRHYSYRTEQTYLDWVKRYLHYAREQGVDFRSTDGVRSYLSYLATARNVSASTQNQAFNALLFLNREVLGLTMDSINAIRAKRGPKLPVVLTPDEVKHVFANTEAGTKLLMLQLTYGAGLRVSELIRLRVKDLDFDNLFVFVRAAKGDKDRATLLPRKLVEPLKEHLKKVKELHERDLTNGHGAVFLPGALERKYPAAAKEFGWQYVFPAAQLSVDPRSGAVRRHHVVDKVLQNAMRAAVSRAAIHKPASVHTLRHSFATHLLMKGVNIREVQEYLGHQSVETTMIYTHVIRDMTNTADSPLDNL